MTAIRQSDGNLRVTNLETFLLALVAGFVLVGVGIWFTPATAAQSAGWDAVLVLFTLGSVAGVERSDFLFDQKAKTVTWSRRTVFRNLTGTIRFADISGVGFERSVNTAGRPSNARRLALYTTLGPVPVTNAYTGVLAATNAVGGEIASYLSVPFERLPG